VIAIPEKDELVNDLTNMLYNFYFEEKSENEIALKLTGKEVISIVKDPKGGVTLKEDIHRILGEYSTSLVNAAYSAFNNLESYKKIKEMFVHEIVGSTPYLPSVASVSYGLIECNRKGWRLSGDIISVLKRFRYDPRSKLKSRAFPLMQVCVGIADNNIQ